METKYPKIFFKQPKKTSSCRFFIGSAANIKQTYFYFWLYIDSWGPQYDKYHITQLTLGIQTIKYLSTVSNPAFVLLGWNMPALTLGAHHSRKIPSLTRISCSSFMAKCLNIILGHAKLVWSKVELSQVIFFIKKKHRVKHQLQQLFSMSTLPV